ncbi:MAG: TonB-dependent receptor [Erythrobacter sp.]
MKYKYLCAAAAAATAALTVHAPVLAQDGERASGQGEAQRDSGAIIVSASRSADAVMASDYTGSATVLSADDVRDRQTRELADILRDVPGVAVNSTPGLTQIRLRGSEGNHVLVLVDGIEAASPYYGEADIGTLQTEIGARVEILRGPQSALYGSDAVAGVVAYQSASGRELSGVSARFEAGTQGRFNAAARAGFAGENTDLALSAAYVSSDGEPNARGGNRNLGFDSLTLSGKGNWDVAPSLSLRAVGRYVTTDGDFNEQDFDSTSPTLGLVLDSPGVSYENEAFYALIGASFAASGAWSHDISGQIADVARDTFSGDLRTSGNVGQRLKGSYVTTLVLGGPVFQHTLTAAVDVEREKFRNNNPFGPAFNGFRTASNTGLVGEYRLSGDRFDLSAAVRQDFNNRFQDATTFRVAAGVQAGPTTRLRAAGGSGIKNPGFFQLFGFFDGQFIGNEDLQAEKSSGWEVGIDQSLASDAVSLSLTYFNDRLKGEVFTAFPAPDFLATPLNRDTTSKRQGIEVSANAQLGAGFTIDAAYSWLDAEENGEEEVRRPDHIASAALNWVSSDDRASANVTVRYNGAAQDVAFTDPSFVPVRVTLDEFTLVNFNFGYRLNDQVELFVRAENLLDDQYEQVFSFTNPGRSVLGGVHISL